MDSLGIIRCPDLEMGLSASLAGSGTIAGSLRNLGKLSLNSLPNTLVVEGSLELKPSSILETTIAFWNGKVQAGRLDLRGAVTLGGILKLVIPNPAVLQSGDEFEIAGFAQPPLGSFGSLDDSALGSALKAEVVTSRTGLKVKITAR